MPRRRMSAQKRYNRLSKKHKEKVDKYLDICKQLLIDHGILDYTVGIINSRYVNGQCNSISKKVSLNIDLILYQNEAKIRNTILHEIAHALTPGAGHRFKWQEKAKELGVTWTRNYHK